MGPALAHALTIVVVLATCLERSAAFVSSGIRTARSTYGSRTFDTFIKTDQVGHGGAFATKTGEAGEDRAPPSLVKTASPPVVRFPGSRCQL